MRTLVMKYVAAIMAIWYLVGVIGLDVHSCSATGDVFVHSALRGVTCEDVHPGHDCNDHGSCCGHPSSCCHSDCGSTDPDEAVSVDAASACCTTEITALDTPSVCSSNAHDHSECCDCGLAPAYVCVTPTAVPSVVAIYSYTPDSGLIVPERQAFLHIWRI